mgnify:CR=1 FL=1
MVQLANKFSGGLVLGLCIPALALFVYFIVIHPEIGFFAFIAENQRVRLLSPLLSLAALLNLAAFYFFLQKKWFKTVQGVISATLIYALLILLLKFVL